MVTTRKPKNSHALFRISVGGFPLLKYDVLLCQLVDAIAFGLDDVHKMLKQKLTEVDRIQAKLGVMRTFRGGILLTDLLLSWDCCSAI